MSGTFLQGRRATSTKGPGSQEYQTQKLRRAGGGRGTAARRRREYAEEALYMRGSRKGNLGEDPEESEDLSRPLALCYEQLWTDLDKGNTNGGRKRLPQSNQHGSEG
jgi:hypothetical protein